MIEKYEFIIFLSHNYYIFQGSNCTNSNFLEMKLKKKYSTKIKLKKLNMIGTKTSIFSFLII